MLTQSTVMVCIKSFISIVGQVYHNNKCIIVCLTMYLLQDVNREVSIAYC